MDPPQRVLGWFIFPQCPKPLRLHEGSYQNLYSRDLFISSIIRSKGQYYQYFTCHFWHDMITEVSSFMNRVLLPPDEGNQRNQISVLHLGDDGILFGSVRGLLHSKLLSLDGTVENLSIASHLYQDVLVGKREGPVEGKL